MVLFCAPFKGWLSARDTLLHYPDYRLDLYMTFVQTPVASHPSHAESLGELLTILMPESHLKPNYLRIFRGGAQIIPVCSQG